MIINAIRFSLMMDSALGLEFSKQFLQFATDVELDLQLLRLKLLIAIKTKDQLKVVETWLQLGIQLQAPFTLTPFSN